MRFYVNNKSKLEDISKYMRDNQEYTIDLIKVKKRKSKKKKQ